MRTIFLFLSMITSISFAQVNPDAKRDFNWVFGYENTPPYYGMSVIDFNTPSPSNHYHEAGLNMFVTNSSISDETGNLLFYTNGMFVADSTHNVMPHGDSINYGYYYNSMGNSFGYPLLQGAIILPFPNHPDLYFIIHELAVIDFNFYSAERVDGLYFTQINMVLHNGLGDVYENQKNIPILFDTLDYGYITAVRHGNGRDWWIIVRELSQNCFYRILLSPSGFTNYGIQCIGTSNNSPSFPAQTVFSQDGSIYARSYDTSYSSPTVIELYSFDRCSGNFSNFRSFSLPNTSMWQGMSLSPNSHYLYFSNQSHVYQYDITVDSILSTQEVIANYDTFVSQNGMPVTYNQQVLAPDGKIYIEGGNTQYFSVINDPDNDGALCNFQAHSFAMPTYNEYSMPNFPNFRLGKLVESPCDTLIVSVTNPQKRINTIEAYPNPASEIISVSFDIKNNNYPMTLDVFNGLSIKVAEIKISPFQGLVNLDVSGFAPGIYYSVLKNGKQVVGRCKFSVVH